MIPEEARARLAGLLAAPGRRVPLAEAALLLAVDEYPGLEPTNYLDQLDDLARTVAERAAGRDEAVARIASLRQVVFEETGFLGNRDAYEDPRNSYLNQVLDRRLGIPITLSLVVVEIGRRLGWPLFGVNFPLHFLVRYGTEPPYYALDPFHGGLILAEEEVAERWQAATHCPAPPLREILPAAADRTVLARLLNNLKLGYSRARDFRRAARVTEQQLLLEPNHAIHYRDLGYLHLLSRRVESGVTALQRYLRMRPGAPDRDAVLDTIQQASESGIRWQEPGR
jgi:regulator of sirC expression with transglutaminase-like and TPR domain